MGGLSDARWQVSDAGEVTGITGPRRLIADTCNRAGWGAAFAAWI
jgi:hypothetical protein